MGADALVEGPIAVSQARVRAFFGLPIPDTHREILEPYLAGWAAAAPQFRWVPPANLHLTVRFLGHVELSLAESVVDSLETEGLHGFELELGAIGYFKRGRLARVVWIGLASGAEAAAFLAAAVENRCQQAGLQPETRAFNPHLTLARAKARDGAATPTLDDPPALPPWRAEELVLYRSQMGRAGSVYEPMRRITLS